MSEYTPWFPNTIKPVRKGVYAVFTPNSKGNKFAYFDKKKWNLCGSSIQDAQIATQFSDHWPASSMYIKGSKWRGLTKETT